MDQCPEQHQVRDDSYRGHKRIRRHEDQARPHGHVPPKGKGHGAHQDRANQKKRHCDRGQKCGAEPERWRARLGEHHFQAPAAQVRRDDEQPQSSGKEEKQLIENTMDLLQRIEALED